LSDLPNINPREPVRLIPVDVTKPWGKEIWYSGIEARGESQVQIGGQHLPISLYLQSNPTQLSRGAPVLLLKVLDPKTQPVLGDLYFEVHETKQEVYVVTHIDPDAWPDAVGGIRLGMNQDKRRQYDGAPAFRAAYLHAVENYEHVRRQIDEQGVDITPAQEELARTRMDSFTNLRALRVGDVVRVPTWTPHSLLHGVRVVEFQTATYERFIISFAQQVVTQQHWDSEHAIANMSLEAPAAEIFEAVSEGIERIACFSDFNVWRVDLDAAGRTELPPNIPYAVCMCITGGLRIGSATLQPEQACFVPYAALTEVALSGTGTVLVAAPNL